MTPLLPSRVDLYAVISTREGTGEDPTHILERVIAAGVQAVQMREKHLSRRERFRLAEIFRRKTSDAGRLLIINDDIDIALSVGADGVHLGREDLPVGAARTIGPGLIIGRSTRSAEESLAAEAAGAGYVNVGPIFSTPTKPGISPVGLKTFREVRDKVSIPVTVMGGINRGNLHRVLEAGVRTVAMVRGITEGDIENNVSELCRAYNSYVRV